MVATALAVSLISSVSPAARGETILLVCMEFVPENCSPEEREALRMTSCAVPLPWFSRITVQMTESPLAISKRSG